ncbi:MAG: ATP/ADP translocase [Myxococcota bacterium]
MSDNATSRLSLVTGLSVAVAVLMIAQQVAGKAVRDAFFLSVYEVEVLTQVMTAASVVSVAAVLLVMRLYRRISPARLVPLLFGGSAGLFALEWVLVQAGSERAAALTIYIHMASMGAVAISGFWAVLNERFDPFTAKRVIGRVASGATAGGVVGGLAAWQGAATMSISTMLLALMATNAICGVCIYLVGRGTPAPTKAPPAASTRKLAILDVFESSPYLRHVATLVLLIAFGTAGVDYVFKATAAAAYDGTDELVSFFALFYLGTGIAAFVIQNTFSGVLLRRFGIGGAVATLPLVLMLFGPIALLLPGLFAMTLLSGGTATAENSSYRSGYELLYTPLDATTKRPVKTLIDVGADKLGAAIGGAFAVFVVGLLPEAANVVLVITAVVCAVAALASSRALARGYIDALAARLKSRTLDEAAIALLGDDERQAVEATLARIDTAAVLRDLAAPIPSTSEALDAVVDAVVAEHQTQAAPMPAAKKHPKGPGAFEVSAAALMNAAPEAVIAALRSTNPVPRSWVGALLPRLSEDACADAVAQALTRAAPANLGALFDALGDPALPSSARLRIVGIASQVPTQRCVDELVRALDSDVFPIRFAVARALRDVATKRPSLLVPTAQLAHRVERELETIRQLTVRSQLKADSPEAPDVIVAGRGFALCLLLLGHEIPEAALWRAVQALATTDRQSRGTALEYLHNVLGADLATEAGPLLANPAIAKVAMDARGAAADTQTQVLTPSLDELKTRLGDARAIKQAQPAPG